MKEPKNGRLALALKLVDDLVELGHRANDIVRQIEELYPYDPDLAKIRDDLAVYLSDQHAELRRLITKKHHR